MVGRAPRPTLTACCDRSTTQAAAPPASSTAPQHRRRRPHPGFRPDIEGLRAVAVLAVVFYHANVGFLSGGFVGVDVFFVISGFLITRLLWREVDGRRRLSFAGVLRPAGPPDPAGGHAGAGRNDDRLAAAAAAAADALGLEGRPVDRPLRRQLPLRCHQDQLPGRLDPLPVPALLVARRRGAVLPGLAPAAGGDLHGVVVASSIAVDHLRRPWPRPAPARWCCRCG